MGKEMKGTKIKSIVLFGIVFLLLTINIPSNSLGQTDTVAPVLDAPKSTLRPSTNTASITLYNIGKNRIDTEEKKISTADALRIYKKYQELQQEITTNPVSDSSLRIQQEFIDILIDNDVIPPALSKEQMFSFIKSPPLSFPPLRTRISPFQNKASEWFCNFVSFGQGSAFPIIILPRLIPFLLSPIPRAFVWWSTPSGVTSVGGLISRTGFIAQGDQKGLALGFWGIGFSIFLPPIMSYGIFGYALYSRVTAENIELWPPNNPPEITQTDPTDGEQMVPITTAELRFEIKDADNELMSYNVTTEPHIGSGSGGLRPDGTYAISVSHLESLTTYTWRIEVTDGEDVVEKILTFTTEPAAPLLSDPYPADGEKDVPMDISSLRFTLKDYQGDPMDYTVQTSPNIGYASATGIYDGTYFIPVSGLTYGVKYRWYVNVTDGVHWVRKIYTFTTGYPSPFDPFTFGWQYRKQITINHIQVVEDLINFPLLIRTTDIDLTKAQTDGDDILFMNGPGAAIKLHHEIESFKVSSGELVVWVNIPYLSSSENVTIYLYYGNPDCISQEYPEKTWDTNYKGVWHMSDESGNIYDSTASSICIKNGNPTYHQIGKVGHAIYFDGAGDFFDGGDDGDFDFGTGPMTVECWLWSNSATNRIPLVKKDWSTHGKGWMLWSSSTKTYFHISSGYSSIANCYIEDSISNSLWRHVVGRRNGDSIYLNLDFFNSISKTGASSYDLSSSWKFKIADDDGIEEGYEWIGLIDEIRLSDVCRTDSWILTEYLNQNNPEGFITIGSEETGP